MIKCLDYPLIRESIEGAPQSIMANFSSACRKVRPRHLPTSRIKINTCLLAMLSLGIFARSDETKAEVYNFNYNSISGIDISSYGTFNLIGANITEVSGTLNLSTGTVNIFYTSNSTLNNGSISTNFIGTGNSFYYPVIVSFSGVLSNDVGNYSGQVTATLNSFDANGRGSSEGFFSAILASGGSSGSGSSGGAPSPEINALLGLALAGGTFIFLRRRRNDPREATPV